MKLNRLIVVTGDRNWGDFELVATKMASEPNSTIFMHGNATGADQCCDEGCSSMGYPRMRVPYIGKLGRAGGPVRNDAMKQVAVALQTAGWEVEVWAFHDDMPHSEGTKDMVVRCRKAGLKVRAFRHKGGE